jgi:hypothetical protein
MWATKDRTESFVYDDFFLLIVPLILNTVFTYLHIVSEIMHKVNKTEFIIRSFYSKAQRKV